MNASILDGLDSVDLGASSGDASGRLRAEFMAARVGFVWLGVRKSLSSEQKNQAADSFGADGDYMSAGKKLLDTRHPAYRALTAIRNRAVALWKGLSLPFPEPGIRLIRQADISTFDGRMHQIRDELAGAVQTLEEHFDELKATARQQLGSLYNSADYPDSLADLFSVSWDFPSVEPPDYLRELRPDIWEQERARIASRFDEAVRLAEESFIDELAKLVSHLGERLSGAEDGKPKIFRDSAVDNLGEFFERFQRLNIRNNAQLDALVARTRDLVGNVKPETLRQSSNIRQAVAAQLSGIQASLDGMLIDRPRRKIIRAASQA
jgi:hypothetical protein